MGDWNTLHLIDEQKYQSKTLAILKNEDLLAEYFAEYLKRCLANSCQWTAELIVKAVELNQAIFEDFCNPDTVFDMEEQGWNTVNNLGEYHFRRFVTFLIFRTAAQFYPYFRLGKNYMHHAIDWDQMEDTSGAVLEAFFMGASFFNWDGDGIRKIITCENLSVLLLDVDQIVAKDVEDSAAVQELIEFLNYADQHKLSVLAGQNLDENLLKNEAYLLDQHMNKNLTNLIYDKG